MNPTLARESLRMSTRQQEWLALALLTALATVVFEIWPRLDLAFSQLFFKQGAFEGSQWAWAKLFYHGMPIGQLIYFPVDGEIEVKYNRKQNAKYSGQANRPVESMMWKNRF